jgi:hypothetical protein
MTGFIVSVFPFRNHVSFTEAFEGLELGEGKPSRPVLRGPGGRKAAWLLGNWNRSLVRYLGPQRHLSSLMSGVEVLMLGFSGYNGLGNRRDPILHCIKESGTSSVVRSLPAETPNRGSFILQLFGPVQHETQRRGRFVCVHRIDDEPNAIPCDVVLAYPRCCEEHRLEHFKQWLNRT